MLHDIGGEKFTVGEDDYKITVNLPPEGMAWNPKTKQLEEVDIICRSGIKEDQFWERPEPPEDWDELRDRERVMQGIDSDFANPDLEAYRQREWRRRNLGVWLMNNGKMIYITGTHYFFLTHWQLDIGFPDFRMTDVEFFYAWDYCSESPDIAGLLLLTKRRQGKTAKSGVIMYERTSRTRKVRGGIQSKTEEDARDIVFFNGLVQPFTTLLDFFVPVFDTGKSCPPTVKLRFFR